EVKDLAGNPLPGTSWSLTVSESSWISLGGAVNPVSGHDVSDPVLALDPSGNPVVAFTESDGTRVDAYVEQWDGQAWERIGDRVNPIAGHDVQPSTLALAVGSDGAPVLSFRESDGNRNNLFVVRWTGRIWEELGLPQNAIDGI